MIPAGLEQYWGMILLVLTFVDGLIFGVAIKRALASAILFIIGILLAGFIGLSLPLPSSETLTKTVLDFLIQNMGALYNKIGTIVVGLPVLFIIGLLVGLLKG
ncbi:MAG: hypothetical protein ACP5GU_05865 [Thermoprotei archaeon]